MTKRQKLMNNVKTEIQSLIKNRTTVHSSVTASQLVGLIRDEMSVSVKKSTVRRIIKRLIGEGEEIISLRNGHLRGYRYSKSPMEYFAAARESEIMEIAFSKRRRKMEHKRNILLEGKKL